MTHIKGMGQDCNLRNGNGEQSTFESSGINIYLISGSTNCKACMIEIKQFIDSVQVDLPMSLLYFTNTKPTIHEKLNVRDLSELLEIDYSKALYGKCEFYVSEGGKYPCLLLQQSSQLKFFNYNDIFTENGIKVEFKKDFVRFLFSN